MKQKGNMCKHYARITFISRKKKKKSYATQSTKSRNESTLQCPFNIVSTSSYGDNKIIQELPAVRCTYVGYNFLLGSILLDSRLLHRKKQLVKPTIPSHFVLKNACF